MKIIMDFIVLLVVVFFFSHSADGLVYHCASDEAVAYTPDGSFQRLASTEVSGPCVFNIPQSLFRTPQSKLEVTIELINTTTGSTCDEEFLLINGNQYCQTPAVRQVITINQTSTSHFIIFNSTLDQSLATFILHYTVYTDICDNTDVIVSWPVILRSNQLTLPSTAANCNSLQLNVSHFDQIIAHSINNNQSDSCDHNAVMAFQGFLRDGSERLLCQGVVCLDVGGFDVTNITRIRVAHISAVACSSYWKVTAFTQNAPQDICSLTGSNLTLLQGQITSPKYNGTYTGPRDCSVSIPEFEVVLVTIMSYALKKIPCKIFTSNPCDCGDRLVINGTSKCGSFSGRHSKVYKGSDVPLAIQLIAHSHILGSSNGFFLTYKGFSNALDICNLPDGELSLPLTLKSPNFPNPYPDSKSCKASVSVLGSRDVLIELLSLSTDLLWYSNNCSYDYLSINTKRYCGSTEAETIPANANLVRIDFHFRSDHEKSSSGFYLHIQARESTTTPATTTSTATSTSTSSSNSASTSIASTATASSTISNTPVTEEVFKLSSTTYKATTAAVSGEADSGTVVYEEITDKTVKVGRDSRTKHDVPTRETTSVDLPTPAKSDDGSSSGRCPVPWYYWVLSLVAILLAVIVTIIICLIRFKRLKVTMTAHHYLDTDIRSSRDGILNPVYYSSSTFSTQTPPTQHSNGQLPHNFTGVNPYYTNTDRAPAGKRVIINTNSTQTTV